MPSDTRLAQPEPSRPRSPRRPPEAEQPGPGGAGGSAAGLGPRVPGSPAAHGPRVPVSPADPGTNAPSRPATPGPHRRGTPYPRDLRAAVLAACDAGLGVRAVARRLGVSPSYVVKVRKRRDATGETEARSRVGRPAPRLLAHEALLRGLLEAAPIRTLPALRDTLAAQHGIHASKTTIWRALRRLGLRCGG